MTKARIILLLAGIAIGLLVIWASIHLTTDKNADRNLGSNMLDAKAIEETARSAEWSWFEVKKSQCLELGRYFDGPPNVKDRPLAHAYRSENVFFLQYKEAETAAIRSFTNSGDFCRKMASISEEAQKLDMDFKARR